MKQFHKLTLSALSILTIPLVYAVDTHNGDISGDLYFPNGVLLEDTTSSSEGNASVSLGGDGSLTIGNQAGPGGFPRLTVVGGTTISSKRDFPAEETNITTWSGQFSAPGSTIKPSSGDITFIGGHQVDSVEIMDAFNWGLANETFTFGPAARVMLPIDAQDGQKLWIAYEGTDSWSAQDEDFCVVLNGLCYTEVASVNKLAVVKKQYDSCPRSSVSDGTVGSAPNCIITCDNGFELGESADSCVEASGDDLGFTEDTGTSDSGSEETGDSGETAFIVPEKEYQFPPGHFRFRSSVDNMYRYLDESGLEDEELEIARHVNTTYLSRNPRTAEEQLEAQASTTAQDSTENEESFVNYLIQMRNRFGDNAQENHFVALSEEEGGGEETASSSESSGEVAESGGEESSTFHSSGGLLPSTGPGMFLTIAIIGIGLMMFGFRRS